MDSEATAVVSGVELACAVAAHANAAEAGCVDVVHLLEEVALEGLTIFRNALVERLKVGLGLNQIWVGFCTRTAEERWVDGSESIHLKLALIHRRECHKHFV